MSRKTMTLDNAKKIAKWCEERNRTPRTNIVGIKVSKNKKAETDEQKELRLGQALRNINKNYLKKYEGVELEDIGEEIDREIFRLIREILEQNNKKLLILNNAKEIAEWCEEKNRIPRRVIEGIKVSENKEAETEEQEELRLGHTLRNINNNYLKKYEGIELEDIEDEVDREIVRLIREVKKRYSEKILTLNNVKEIVQWCEEKGRTPRTAIEGIKISKSKEAETDNEKELRLGHSLSYINRKYLGKYTGVELEDIEDKTDREIVRLIREVIEGYSKKYIREKKRERKPNYINQTYLERYEGVELEDIGDEIEREAVRIARAAEKYKKNTPEISGNIENFDKLELAKMIVGLIKSRHATLEQIQVIADYYNVDLEATLGSLETHNTLELR